MKKAHKITSKRSSNKILAKPEEDELEEWKRSKQLLKPKDQVDLTDTDLKEIIAKVLTTNDPQVPKNLVEFNYAQGAFLPVTPPPNIIVYEQHGTTIHRESEEALRQMLEQGIDPSEVITAGETIGSKTSLPEPTTEEHHEDDGTEKPAEDASSTDKDKEEVEEGDLEVEGEAEVELKPQDPSPSKGGKPRKLTNQFNFCERAALTYNNPVRSQETQTIPPPMGTFSANVLAWVIYDEYQEDYEALQMEKELERERKEKDKAPVSKFPGATVKKSLSGKGQLSEAVQGRVLECWKVLERMINQNTYADIAKDYRYWDDPSDEFRDEEGTLLPLWKFFYDKTKRNTITDLIWNPCYYDLFAACFGYLDFMKPIPGGAVCLFTLKNPSFPDYICMTDSAVMSVDIHKRYPYMIVLGLHNGNVAVYNIQQSCKIPLYESNNVADKHKGIVWEVKWANDLPDGELNFYSGGADGQIINWVLMQSELAATVVITLYQDKAPVSGPDGTEIKVKGSCTCIKLHPSKNQIYLVGTEEGFIYKCSIAYSSTYLITYKAHQMPVYKIDFNRYNTNIFISCGGDWRVKIWEDNRLEPLFVFDLGTQVGDVKFAPYSSTVFAAVTSDGRVHVFDLNVNKYKPIAVQQIVSKRRHKLTRLTFNTKLPILIVGDDKGCITSLKLSPNLRIPCKAPKKQQHLDQWTLQCMKFEKLLALVREPAKVELPEDTAGNDEDD